MKTEKKCCSCSCSCSPWWLVVGFVLFVVNIRVEAGLATGLERTIDGLVGGTLFLLVLYYAGRFFHFLEIKDD